MAKQSKKAAPPKGLKLCRLRPAEGCAEFHGESPLVNARTATVARPVLTGLVGIVRKTSTARLYSNGGR
jgi:hypothetical protein